MLQPDIGLLGKNFKKVLVVSAKADVREEWKKTVQSADNFNQDYVFLSSEELLRDENIVSDTLASEKGIVLFLTLQDLQGTEIKTKHKSVKCTNKASSFRNTI